jgi:hypothetical protein
MARASPDRGAVSPADMAQNDDAFWAPIGTPEDGAATP